MNYKLLVRKFDICKNVHVKECDPFEEEKAAQIGTHDGICYRTSYAYNQTYAHKFWLGKHACALLWTNTIYDMFVVVFTTENNKRS